MSRKLVVAALLIASSILALCDPGSAIAEELSAAGSWTEGTLRRDQPKIHRLFLWGDRLIVHADAFYALDVSSAKLERLACRGAATMQDLAPIDTKRAGMLCRDHNGSYLMIGDFESATRIELPERISGSPGLLRVFGGNGALGVWGGGDIYVKPGGQSAFTTVQLPVHLGEVRASDPLLLKDSSLFLGYDRGEWGGGLLVVDLSTGQTEVTDVRFPVTDLKVDASGKLWLAGGLSHLTLRRGYLWRLDGKIWSIVLATDNIGKEVVLQDTAWLLPPDEIAAVAFDRVNVPHVIAGHLGVVRYEAGVWTPITPFWPRKKLIPVRGLEITADSTLVIATLNGGVLLWKRGDSIVRRVTFRP